MRQENRIISLERERDSPAACDFFRVVVDCEKKGALGGFSPRAFATRRFLNKSFSGFEVLCFKSARARRNVDKLGRICLDILKDKWSPALQIRTVLLSIQALLSAPNPDDPLDNGVAELWKGNEPEALKKAMLWTQRYAMEGGPS